jgi:hypothetical protein
MSDNFANTATGMSGPASDAFSIIPDDVTALAQTTRAIYTGSGGDIALVMQGGNTVSFKTVPAGVILPLRASKVMATATTATNMLGLV